jgi:hypothetical protein
MTLAASHQGLSPCATDFMAKAFKPLQVTVYCIVIEVSLSHASQPVPDEGDGFVSPTHQGFPQCGPLCTHAFLDCQPDDLESPMTAITTAVREPRKVECFRSGSSCFTAILLRETAKP